MSEQDSGDWDDHWRRFADATAANPGHAHRRRVIHRLLAPQAATPGAAILDIGCGSGELLTDLRTRFPEATLAGADGSAAGLAHAAQALPGARLIECDLLADAPPRELAGWASHVICSEVLEHVTDPVRVLNNAAQCLRPGGRLVVTVPGGPMSAFDRHLGHLGHYTRRRLRSELAAAGFDIETVVAAGFPAFNLYRLVVLARGRRLVDDLGGKPSALARAVMAPLRWAMPLSLLDSPWGWLIAGAAIKPGGSPESTGP